MLWRLWNSRSGSWRDRAVASCVELTGIPYHAWEKVHVTFLHRLDGVVQHRVTCGASVLRAAWREGCGCGCGCAGDQAARVTKFQCGPAFRHAWVVAEKLEPLSIRKPAFAHLTHLTHLTHLDRLAARGGSLEGWATRVVGTMAL